METEPKQLKTMLVVTWLSSDETSYMRYTSIERYANDHQIAVIMPNADHSGYSNMKFGHKYFDYVIEVLDYAHQIYRYHRREKITLLLGILWRIWNDKICLNTRPSFYKACPLSSVFNAQSFIDIDWNDFQAKQLQV